MIPICKWWYSRCAIVIPSPCQFLPLSQVGDNWSIFILTCSVKIMWFYKYKLYFSFLFAAGLYGDGVYFTTEPSFACQNKYSEPNNDGIKYVYHCSVCVGRYGKGTKHMKEPPRDRYGYRYDSVVNDVNNPTEHVIFQDCQAYPRYLITFTGSYCEHQLPPFRCKLVSIKSIKGILYFV